MDVDFIGPRRRCARSAVRKARWRVAGNSGQLFAISTARATSRRCADGSRNDVTAQLPIAPEDETQILSVPVRLRRSGREIRMLIEGTDPFVIAKPDGDARGWSRAARSPRLECAAR
jgi:hypothetical protein